MVTQAKAKPNWTFLTNHAHVMLCLAQHSTMRIRDLAIEVGITERAVQRIISELIDEGYLIRIKDGRRNEYKIENKLPLKHPVEAHKTIIDLVSLIYDKP